MLVDSHCHLDFPDFDGELDAVITRASEAGVGYMLTICTHVSRFERVRAVAAGRANLRCSVGIHPHNVAEEPTVSADQLIEIAQSAEVVAFGETGLDFYYDHSPRDAQETSFRTHIAAAREVGLPVIVHSRDADERTAAVLTDEHAKGAFSGVLHCFSSGPELARAALDLGFYISASGIITFKKADELRAIFQDVPLDRLLVETDAPYLAPVPKRGKRNEPAYTAHTAEMLAEIKGVSAAQLADATTDNFFRLFPKFPRPAPGEP